VLRERSKESKLLTYPGVAQAQNSVEKRFPSAYEAKIPAIYFQSHKKQLEKFFEKELNKNLTLPGICSAK
jgi:hypothetical protein